MADGVTGRVPPVAAITGAGLSGGRCIMSRSGVYYAVKAMERVAAGAAADGVAGRPARRAVARPEGIVSLRRRVLAAIQRGTGGARSGARRDSRRLGGAAQAD